MVFETKLLVFKQLQFEIASCEGKEKARQKAMQGETIQMAVQGPNLGSYICWFKRKRLKSYESVVHLVLGLHSDITVKRD